MTLTAATPEDAVVEAQALTRRFGALVAVDGVDLAVRRGEIVGLIGANGAGKTTLIRLLLGLLGPTGGRARLLGAPPGTAGRARTGYVPQGLGLYRDLTVGENIAFVASAYGVEAEPTDVLAVRAPGLEHLSDRLLGSVSLGVRRRVAFAAALLHEPELLILDEPTSGVDPLGRARLWDTVHAAADDGAGVLVTTHHLAEAAQCDRLVLLAAGRVVAAGTPAEIVGAATVVEVRASDWRAAFAVLEEAGCMISLAGRRLRIAATTPRAVRTVLDRSGIEAHVEEAAATLEERFVELAA